MPNPLLALLLAAVQQQPATGTGLTSPPNGDTTGYWQQAVHYTITATLDERARRVRSRGTLRYANNSPDTLREMYFHQYLNAFRPASLWSRVDEREGRVRFQHLEDPDYGYERFTAPVRVNGVVAPVSYPGTPDSTVARIALAQPIAPGDTAVIEFEWDARPSTVPRRQGRRGRHWDLAQWYPKVAVYDRGGWEYNALQPAGEFYGEFGTYDVTLIVADDQVLAATGVPVAGDPGWARVARGSAARTAADAYGALPPLTVEVPAGHRAVRFVGRDIHHFAWSASPDFIYEGGVLVRQLPPTRFRAWDTVSIHVLYRPGDDTTWGGQRVVRRTQAAIAWLERIYGPYAYPQMTVMHRLDGGGTEFPMLQANGSPSQGLILHEGGHIWSYGILADNEWRSGWMDEGLTSYQTAWAQALTPQERVRANVTDRFAPITGYRARAIRMRLPRFESLNLGQTATDLEGAAEPIGIRSQDFRDFGTYNDMIYNRGELMYGQLRDAVGDSAFLGFLHDYYARWALRHVDERAMNASAQRTSGRDLDWFFRQWVHETGVMDYALGDVRTTRDGDAWVTEAKVRRRGEYRHPMSVGVRTASGWTLGRMAHVIAEDDVVRIRTTEEPLEVRLDPYHFSWDWDRRNDVRRSRNPLRAVGALVNLDWPFLEQADREKDVVLFAPIGWYSSAGGPAVGFRERGNYLGFVDRTEGGLAWYLDPRTDDLDVTAQLQAWWRFSNPYLPWMRRPAMGWYGGVANLDGVLFGQLGRERTYAAGVMSRTIEIALNYANVFEPAIVPEFWDARAGDISIRLRSQRALRRGYVFLEPRTLAGFNGEDWYTRGEVAAGLVRQTNRSRLALRLYGGVSDNVVPQRALFLSTEDPVGTYWNHFWRPREGLLKRPGFNFLPLGGAGMRGYSAGVAAERISAANADGGFRIGNLPNSRTVSLWAHAFGDVGALPGFGTLTDAGVGLSIRGRLFDRDINLRLDSPFFVNEPGLSIGRELDEKVAPRWVLTFRDLW